MKIVSKQIAIKELKEMSGSSYKNLSRGVEDMDIQKAIIKLVNSKING